MSKLQESTHARGGGFSIFSIAIILMVAGWVMDTSDYEAELGVLLFTIGWWLFMISLAIILIVIGIILLVAVFAR